LWVSATPLHGLRRIEPGALPADLRARPSTSFAYQFLLQPFRLDLSIEASPPLVRAESKTWYWIDSELARSETLLQLHRVRGRAFEIELNVAPGLEVISVEPAEFVERWNVSSKPAVDRSGRSRKGTSKLTIELTTVARDQGRVDLRITGLQRIGGAPLVELALATLDERTLWSSSFALYAERGILLELEDLTGRLARSIEPAPQTGRLPRDWPESLPRKEPGPAPLLLVGETGVHGLPVRIERHRRSLSHETAISARVSRLAVEVLERTTISVRHGALEALEIRVPAAIANRWETLDKEVVERAELGQEADGARRYRLTLRRPVTEKAAFRFRYRIPLSPKLDPKTAREISLPWISCKDVGAGPVKLGLSLLPEVALEQSDSTWVRGLDETGVEPIGEGSPIEFTKEEANPPDPFVFRARGLESVPLPGLVAPRVLIKTVLQDGAPRHKAWFALEARRNELPFSLPAGARWIGARVDGKSTDLVAYDPEHSSYLLRLSAEPGLRPVLIELEYQEGPAASGAGWQAPRLLEGTAVLESVWEVHVPGNLAVLGVPPGWADENHWYWDSYIWNRGPFRSTAGLTAWVSGAGVTPAAIDSIETGSGRESQRYVFSRIGQPGSLDVRVVHRAGLVVVCSGAALAIGFLTIFARIGFRTVWLITAGIGLLAVAFVQRSVIFLVFESAFIGIALSLLGVLIQGLLKRVRARSSLPGREASALVGRLSAAPVPGVGSDDSTAIRVRAPSTMDLLPAAMAAPPLAEEMRSSTLERS
jgi:hypothetical protein